MENIKVELTREMFDFFLATMKGKKKRLLSFEPRRVYSPYEKVGMITVQFGDNSQKEKDEHNKLREEWELRMNRTERAIDMLEALK